MESIVKKPNSLSQENESPKLEKNPKLKLQSKMSVKKPSMSKKEAVRFIEDYANAHFLNERVKSIRVKTRLNDFYIYATVWNYYGKCWFEDPVARLQWQGDDTYQLAYFRHTGKWHNIFDLVGTLKECLNWVNENISDLFWE